MASMSWNVANGLSKKCQALITFSYRFLGNKQGIGISGATGDGWNVIRGYIKGVTPGKYHSVQTQSNGTGDDKFVSYAGKFCFSTDIPANSQNIRIDFPIFSDGVDIWAIITISAILFTSKKLTSSLQVDLEESAWMFDESDWHVV
uniref:Uncharacterized protein n=1 Tax=Coleopteran tombus-related virus TaxID=2822551 RepID=A0A8A6RKQ4_9TOMB|nr:hypothetical protein [Coleopteran tombus-related virus]